MVVSCALVYLCLWVIDSLVPSLPFPKTILHSQFIILPNKLVLSRETVDETIGNWLGNVHTLFIQLSYYYYDVYACPWIYIIHMLQVYVPESQVKFYSL